MSTFTPEKYKFNYSLNLDSIKDYYDIENNPVLTKTAKDGLYEIEYEFFVLGDDYNVYYLLGQYFKPKDKEGYTDAERDLIYEMASELISICYLYGKFLWNEYYKIFYNSYELDTSKSKKSTNYISNELIELKKLINLFKMYNEIELTDMRLRLKDTAGNVKNDHTIEIGLNDRRIITKILLDNSLENWKQKHLTEKDIKWFEGVIGKELVYKENSPIAVYLNKAEKITSQGIMFLLKEHNQMIRYDLDYLTQLYDALVANWSWDKRASPLNTFNSIVVKAVNRYIIDKAAVNKGNYKIGLKRNKEQAIFSLLRIINTVPNNPSYSVDAAVDAKEDYIKDLLKK